MNRTTTRFAAALATSLAASSIASAQPAQPAPAPPPPQQQTQPPPAPAQPPPATGDQPADPYAPPPAGAYAGAPYAPYAPPPPPPADVTAEMEVNDAREGRLEMTGIGAMIGLGTGLVLVDLRDIDDANIGTIGVLGTTAAGAGLGYMVADRMDVTRGQSEFSMVGMAVGAANAAFLAKPLSMSDDTEEWGPFVVASSAAGAAAGLALGRGVNYTPGQSLFTFTLASAGLYSTLLGVAIAQEGDLEDDDHALESMALGLDAGVVAGAVIAPHLDWSPARARFVGISTVVGAAAGISGGALVTGDNKDARTLGTAGLVGLWGGMVAGALITSDWEPDARYRKEIGAASSPTAPSSGAAPGPGAAPVPPPPPAPSYTVLPAVGPDQVGLAVAGAF